VHKIDKTTTLGTIASNVRSISTGAKFVSTKVPASSDGAYGRCARMTTSGVISNLRCVRACRTAGQPLAAIYQLSKAPVFFANLTIRLEMGKRGREPKQIKESVSDGPAADGPDFVAYASDGSDAAPVRDSASSDDESSEEGICLGPGAGITNSDEDAVSDVDVSFEFFDPVPSDVRTVMRLLNEYTTGVFLNAREVAEAIVQQRTVGTCVKITDEPEPVAFISCLNIQKHRQILQGLLNKIVEVGGFGEKGSVSEMIRRGFEEGEKPENRVGLIITERVVNLPPVLVTKMQEAVFSEIGWATEDEEDLAERETFRLRWFLYVTEAYCLSRVTSNSSAKRKRKEGRKDEDVTFPRLEDEAWMEVAEDIATWPIDGAKPGAQGLTRMRMAMVIPVSAVDSLCSKTVELVSPQQMKEDTPYDGAKLAAGNNM
jgi:protein BCP1